MRFLPEAQPSKLTYKLPLVLGVTMVGDTLVVEKIEECGPSCAHLEDGGQLGVTGQNVLVVPSPVGSTNR